MSHTLGPWTVVHYEWKDKGGGDFVGRIQGPNGEKVYGGASSFHAINNLANARLIATAPEMYDVCETVAGRTDEVQVMMEREGFVIDDLDDRWQKFAFTLYSILAHDAAQAERAIRNDG